MKSTSDSKTDSIPEPTSLAPIVFFIDGAGRRPDGGDIIIVNEPDDKLSYAALPIGDLVKVKYYKVNFQISDTHPVE